MINMRSQPITVHHSEKRIKYQLFGNGPPVLLIMGYLARGRAWSAQIKDLSSNWTTLSFDHYGVGDSEGDSSNSMRSFVNDCLSLMDDVGWESAHIIGVSMGGMIAQNLAIQSPKRARSLTLIVTHPGGLFSVLPPLRGWLPFLKVQLARNPQARLKALAELLIPRRELAQRSWPELAMRLGEDFSPTPPKSTHIRQMKAILRHDVRKKLPTLDLPTLVIKASKDCLVSPHHSDTLHRLIPNSDLLIFEDAGHGLIRREEPDLNQGIDAHLARAEERWSQREFKTK